MAGNQWQLKDAQAQFERALALSGGGLGESER
jgi:hypothetical protein